MATEKGVVTKVYPTHALVMTTKSSACEACSSRDACEMMGGGNQVEIKAINTADARLGDRVVISIKPSSLFKLTFLLYILPIIMLLIGAILGENMASSMDPSVLSAMLGFVFFFASLIGIVFITRRLEKKKVYQPEIIRILPPEKPNRSERPCH